MNCTTGRCVHVFRAWRKRMDTTKNINLLSSNKYPMCVCACVCHLLNSFLSSRSFILLVSSVFDRFSVGNWITRLTQNKCVNGFSSKIKRNVIKMMSLRTAIQINKHSCYIPIQLFNSTNSETDSDSRQIFWIFLPP